MRAELAGVLGFTRARVTQMMDPTQMMDLTLLAPDIQEEILVAELEPGRDSITEHALRPIARLAAWTQQRVAWRRAFVPFGTDREDEAAVREFVCATLGIARLTFPLERQFIGVKAIRRGDLGTG